MAEDKQQQLYKIYTKLKKNTMCKLVIFKGKYTSPKGDTYKYGMLFDLAKNIKLRIKHINLKYETKIKIIYNKVSSIGYINEDPSFMARFNLCKPRSYDGIWFNLAEGKKIKDVFKICNTFIYKNAKDLDFSDFEICSPISYI